MELQVVLPDESPAMPAQVMVELARRAEDLGYTTAWLPDHILRPGDYGPVYGGVYEPLISIGYLSARTNRIRFGTSVLIVPLRNPFVLAKQVATLQELSEGRMVLGVGVGWDEREFNAVGADSHSRGATTDDALAVLRHVHSGDTGPYRARRFSYDAGFFAPVPRVTVPLMVGGNSDAALRRAARYGDVWQGLPSSPADFAERAAVLAELSDDRPVVPGLRIGWADGVPVGRIADEVLAYREAGAAQLAVHFGGYEVFGDRMEALRELLADDVSLR